MDSWPLTADELRAEQEQLALAAAPPWSPPDGPLRLGGCFVCFSRGAEGAGEAGDPAWAGAAVVQDGRLIAAAVRVGRAGAPYEPGLLALREGAALEAAVRALSELPDVLLVNATGRDHPRRAGLALHLGAVLGLPSVGVTHRVLLAGREWPQGGWGSKSAAGARRPILIGGELAGYWLRTRAGARPLAVHAGWRVSPAQAVKVVQRALGGARTPEPLRQARRLARVARTEAGG
jgi:deoxyribonuclease V